MRVLRVRQIKRGGGRRLPRGGILRGRWGTGLRPHARCRRRASWRRTANTTLPPPPTGRVCEYYEYEGSNVGRRLPRGGILRGRWGTGLRPHARRRRPAGGGRLILRRRRRRRRGGGASTTSTRDRTWRGTAITSRRNTTRAMGDCVTSTCPTSTTSQLAEND